MVPTAGADSRRVGFCAIQHWYVCPDRTKEDADIDELGAYNCIGKPLALQNLRATVAQLVMTFDVQFAPGYEAEKFDERSKDNFVLGVADLNLMFTPRPS